MYFTAIGVVCLAVLFLPILINKLLNVIFSIAKTSSYQQHLLHIAARVNKNSLPVFF